MIRSIKALSVLYIGLFFLLAGSSNLIDFNSNLPGINHVLSMDTTFKSPYLMWRSVTDTNIHYAAYILIIAWELLCAGLLCVGGMGLLLYRNSTRFNFYRSVANLGLFMGFSLYFLGFITIAGEWFAMWQSREWNVTPTAAIFSSMIMFVLLFLNQDET